MRYLIPILALLLCQEAVAQTFKCTDKAGKVTYASVKCAELGLKDAGEVKDRIQVTPAPPMPSQPSPASRSRSDDDRPVAKPAPAAEPPKEPERRCFTTTVKGKTVTRCNDKPEED